MRLHVIEMPYHLGRRDVAAGQGPSRILSSGIAVELGLPVSRVDAGDNVSVEQSNQALEAEIAAALDSQRTPLILAGNCTSSIATVTALSARQSTGIVWFDAHGDYHTADTTISGSIEGMALTLSSANRVPPNHIALLGARDIEPGERERIASSGMTVIPDAALVNGATLPHMPVYVHLDVDVLDPSLSPGVNCEAPGGWTPEQVLAALRVVFSTCSVGALAIVNYFPERDEDGKTQRILTDLLRSVSALADSAPSAAVSNQN